MANTSRQQLRITIEPPDGSSRPGGFSLCVVSPYLFVLLLLFTSIAFGDNTSKSPRELFPVEVDGKYGYINRTGQIVIAPRFDGASDFSEGMARILVGDYENGDFGYIDTTGKIVIKPKFKGAGLFSEGVAIANDGKTLGVIDKNGNFVLKLKSVKEDALIEGFSEGLAGVALNWKKNYGFYYGFIDLKGKVIIPEKYNDARNFSEGLAAVRVYGSGGRKFGMMGFINKNDQLVIPPAYERASSFHQGLAAVYIDNELREKKCGYINKNGDLVVLPLFKDCSDFSEDMAKVRIDHLYGYINRKGEVVIAPKFTRAFNFSGGLAHVEADVENEDDYSYGYIDKNGEYVWGPKTSSKYP